MTTMMKDNKHSRSPLHSLTSMLSIEIGKRNHSSPQRKSRLFLSCEEIVNAIECLIVIFRRGSSPGRSLTDTSNDSLWALNLIFQIFQSSSQFFFRPLCHWPFSCQPFSVCKLLVHKKKYRPRRQRSNEKRWDMHRVELFKPMDFSRGQQSNDPMGDNVLLIDETDGINFSQ